MMSEMKEQLWAKVWISVHPNKKVIDDKGCWKVNHYSSHVVKSYDYPKWIIDKHRQFFTYIHALIQTRFKNHYVDYNYAGYYPETRERLSSKRRSAISAAQAQVTKIKNVVSEYEAEKNKTLWSDLSTDQVYHRLLNKLEQKKQNLQQAIMMQIEEVIE